jgi:hypothetical protein
VLTSRPQEAWAGIIIILAGGFIYFASLKIGSSGFEKK